LHRSCIATNTTITTTTSTTTATTTTLKHPANALEAAPAAAFFCRSCRVVCACRSRRCGELGKRARVAPPCYASGLKPGMAHMEQRRQPRCARRADQAAARESVTSEVAGPRVCMGPAATIKRHAAASWPYAIWSEENLWGSRSKRLPREVVWSSNFLNSTRPAATLLRTPKPGDCPHRTSAFFRVRSNVIGGLPVGRGCVT